MGSGLRRSNLRTVESRLTSDGTIHCPYSGEAPATHVLRDLASRPGALQLQGELVVLVVDGRVAAVVDGGSKLVTCLRVGFEYAGILEMRADGPAVRFMQS